ncbi:hypothetical protein [Deinococcus xianganensis]|uniref:Uncharacterized protein n=1 Tax=Deinococcus xianganensis TaxID=1507289 RepID=A0A6I4Y7L5_9DEIO|nr:hypothetical protein [Deinococcus xianganensis]MXV18349.1 hypothetical protein [Deinococcus xianganensis]
MTALHVQPAPSLPSLRAVRLRLLTHLRALLTPDATQAHASTALRRTLDAEAHHARMQRALFGVRP